MNPFQTAVFELSVAQITGLNSSPVTLLPGIPGVVQAPVEAMAIRKGARYATHPGNMTVRCVTSSPFAWLTFTAAGGILVNAGTGGRYAWHTGLWQGQAGAGDAANDVSGKPVDLFSLTGNPTVDGTNVGSPIILVLYYRVMPTYEETLGMLFNGGQRVGPWRGDQ